MLSRFALVGAGLVLAACGCGSSHSAAPTTATTTPASPAGTTTVTAGTTTARGGTATAPAASAPTTTKAGYEAAMQTRIDLVAAQCYSPDPAVAATQALRRYRLAVAQLEAIAPPADAAHAHRALVAVTRAYARAAAGRIAPARRLSALIRRARADGHITSGEQTRIQTAQRDLLLGHLPSRATGKREGDALRELARKGYHVAPKGPPKRDYVRRVQALVDHAGNPAKAFRTTSSATDLQAQLRAQRDVAWRSARTLDDVTPPAGVSYAQQKLVGALCERGRLYDDTASSLALRHTPQLVRFSLINARDANRMGGNVYASAFAEYRRAGYRIRPATGPPR
jgi:hypothetical protein